MHPPSPSARSEPERLADPVLRLSTQKPDAKRKAAQPSGFSGPDGDGGNRTHVRGRVKDSFYERSRSSVSRSSVAAPAGFRGASLLKGPRDVRGARRGL